jgi:phage gp29-like protein
MQRDAQVRACLTTKRLAVLSESVEVHPSDGTAHARRAADVVRAQLACLPGGAAGIVAGALDALAMGYAVGEIVWAIDGSLAAVKWHDPRRFAFRAAVDGTVEEVEVLDAAATGGGLRFSADRFVLYAYQPRYGSPFGESDLTAAYEPWTRKAALRKMWLTALDRFGTPLPVARVPSGWSQEQADRLAAQLSNANNESALVVPSEVQIDAILDTGRVEPARAFVAAIEYEDIQIARAILGQELTTQAGGGHGSYALGRVHQGVQDDWIQALRADLAESVLTQQVARRIAVMSLGPDAPAPRVAFPNLTPTELSARRELIGALLDGAVVAPSEPWLRSWLGVPEG